MLKIANLSVCALIFVASISVDPVAASTTGNQEFVTGSQTVISRDGCGWRRHYSHRRGRCVWGW